jgi:hypothetical protein
MIYDMFLLLTETILICSKAILLMKTVSVKSNADSLAENVHHSRFRYFYSIFKVDLFTTLDNVNYECLHTSSNELTPVRLKSLLSKNKLSLETSS